MATIAILDDNVDSCEFLRRLLWHSGHMAVCIPLGEAAIEALKQLKPDLLVLDVRLPGLSGTQLLRLMRGEPALRELRVIMLSGVSDVEVETEALELGAIDYILKGWDWDTMLSRIEQHLPGN